MWLITNTLRLLLSAFLAAALTLFSGGILCLVSIMIIDSSRHSHAHDPRLIDSRNLRMIGQASMIFAADNHDRLPDATDLPDYARQIAIGGGLNDASAWISSQESTDGVPTVLLPGPSDGPRALDPRFAKLPHLFTVVIGGLKATDPNTTPIAWTRGLDLETGVWSKDSPYRGAGGHIAFLGGNVAFYRTLQNSGGGELVSLDGRPTHRIRDALPVGARISADPTPLRSTTEPATPLSERIPRWLNNTAYGVRIAIVIAWFVWLNLVWLRLTVWFARNMEVPIPKARLFDRGGLAIKLTPIILLILSVIFQT